MVVARTKGLRSVGERRTAPAAQLSLKLHPSAPSLDKDVQREGVVFSAELHAVNATRRTAGSAKSEGCAPRRRTLRTS